ncbi:C-type lectin domain family 10 member A-like [Clarias gariepinus]|uniref:C-type lectin domain family 10 member A-like n=1 Tax=Clarias gariepinus TaxID=13013 RepID=UPI00234D497C|nr:C-type lectin domain family 10 member A-like [Clarias gariepinus]
MSGSRSSCDTGEATMGDALAQQLGCKPALMADHHRRAWRTGRIFEVEGSTSPWRSTCSQYRPRALLPSRRDKAPPLTCHTGWSRCYRVTAVCSLMLWVLLLTASTFLLVKFNTRNMENNQLQTKNKDLTIEKDQPQTKNKNLTIERDQLQTRNKNLTIERDQLQTRNKDLTIERDQLQTRNKNLTIERDQLQTRNKDLTIERDQLKTRNNGLQNRLTTLEQRWILFSSSFYYISTKRMNWTESRQDCKERGADLVIINSREEQEFILKHVVHDEAWLGLSDRETEGKWKWVDGTELTASTGYWRKGEPNNSHNKEDCAILWNFPDKKGWNDVPCDFVMRWICEI